MSGFQHDIAGGNGNLVVTSLQSPNFLTGVSGWQVAKSGSAEFNNLTIRGTFFGTDFILNSSGLFFYDGTPASGNLIGSWAVAPGSDAFSNAYTQGLNIGSSMVPQVLIIPGSAGGQGSAIAFPFNTADDTGSTAILGQVVNPGLANQYLQLAIEGPINQNDPAFEQYQTLYNSASDDVTQRANMMVVDGAGNIYLGFGNTGTPSMSIGQPPTGAAAGLPSAFIPIAVNGALLTYSSTSGGTVTVSFTSSGTWTCPTGVTSAKVECWGAGAGGQWASGPGGGGGEYAAELANTVIAGDVYTVTVGAGGAGGTSSSGTGKAGANSSFSGTGATTVTAHGAGVNNTNPSTGGSGSANSVHHSGGGCNTTSGTNHGGGGGGAAGGSSAAGASGGAASGTQPGTGGVATGGGGSGGGGGWGGTTTTSGGAGGSAGGGGGSGGASSSGGSNGAAGGKGFVKITYTQPGTTGIAASFASAAGTDSSGNAYPAGYQGPVVAVEPASSPSVPEVWHTITGATGLTGTIRCKKVAETNMVTVDLSVSWTTTTGATFNIGSLPSAAYYPTTFGGTNTGRIYPLGSNAVPNASTSMARLFVPSSGALQIIVPAASGAASNVACTVTYPTD